jgi:LacI family transcriptional regulator
MTNERRFRMSNTPVTVIDVAKAADVSPSTVSRILNGTTAVNADKRRRVLEAVKRLGYHPNAIAQSLVRGKSMTIGVVTGDISSAYYSHALGGIEQAFINTGYHPLFASANWNSQEEQAAIEMLLARQIDGLIVMGGYSNDEFLTNLSKRLPFVLVGRIVPGIENHCMATDNIQGGFLATQHLISLGHHAIAHITGSKTNPDAVARLQGYRQALETNGIPFEPNLVREGDFLERSGMMAIESLLMQHSNFSAVFTANDQMAVGARLALGRHGLRVPDDVSLIGYDDLPTSQYLYPPLTTVHQPMNEMGRDAVRHVIGLLKGEALKLEVPNLSLSIRESTRRVGIERTRSALVGINTS